MADRIGRPMVEPKTRADRKAGDAALKPGTATTAGTMKQAAFQANSAAAPTQAEFNALLAKLIAAGIMAAS